MTTAAVLSPAPYQQFFGPNGTPLAYGTVATYQAGTTTPIATYTDSTGTTSNTNPITLDAYGICNLWLTPNINYKYVISDSFGNLIKTTDQITVSQLLTLYGGVDTGAANAYILNFVASFSAYANGIVIYFIPSNTNTGASTLNVNGLGNLAIVNIDGSTLGAGQITAGTTAQVIYYQGQWQLLSLGALSGSTIGTFGPVTTIASAATTPLGNATGHVAAITGITSITSFGTASLLAPIYLIKFTGSLALIYNATSMILPGAVNIQTQSGDSCIAQYLGSSNWQILLYNGSTQTLFTAVKPGATSISSSATAVLDPNLQLILPVPSIYSIEGWLNDAGGTSSGGGLKGTIAYSGTGSGNWAMTGSGTAVTAVPLTALGTTAEMQSAQSGVGSMMLSGNLIASTAGTLGLEWAQYATNATASLVAAGSWLRATRLLTQLAASCTPSAVSSIGSATTQTTASVTAAGEGGTGTYTSYSWSWQSGGGSISIDSPSAATTTFTGSGMSLNNTYSGVPACVVTDSSSNMATTTGNVTIVCIAVPTFTATMVAGDWIIGGNTLGYGYNDATGSITTATDQNGNTINQILTTTNNGYSGQLSLFVSGFASNPGSGYFTNFAINGTNYTSSRAGYAYSSGTAMWYWTAPGFTVSDNYTVMYT